MQSEKSKSTFRAFFEKIHPVKKLLISLSAAIIIYFIVQIRHIDFLTHIMIGWDTFSFCMILLTWTTFIITTSQQIRAQASIQDSSRTTIFLIILISTISSFFAILLLLVTKQKSLSHESFHVIIAIIGMVLSWFLIHTIFTLRYAHIYYGDDDENPETHAEGLKFPEDDKPDYLDFAYFSFVLGMTFQVSDVEVTSKSLRRLATWHGLLSFGFNTIMIALTINVIAGFGT